MDIIITEINDMLDDYSWMIFDGWMRWIGFEVQTLAS
jgi:hypothetical protein